ncbi:MAG TPA: 50S ribosomal protein L25 [Magnetospirillaceae bacterium]|nr:50S ribosomal protein L25 [Magnetospirillaceae bacterium]
MGDKIMLTVEERKILGKKVKQLRRQGMIPAVVYGGEMEATPVMAPAVEAEKAWRDAGKHHVVELTLGGKSQLAMIKSADLEPVKRRLRHLSLHVVKQNEKVETEVPIKVAGEGETPAEKAGLVVLKTIETVDVAAFPKDLPDFMEVPGDKLIEAGDHLTVADIIAQSGVSVLSESEQIVVTVYEPSALAAANDAAAGTATDESEVAAENGAEVSPEGEEAEKPADKK